MVICLPSIAGGELFERIVDENFEHTEPTSARYMQQILEGMQYVHKQNIIHLDLKPENIVCVDTTGTRIKIIDFGLATELGEFDTRFCNVLLGTEKKKNLHNWLVYHYQCTVQKGKALFILLRHILHIVLKTRPDVSIWMKECHH